MFVDDRSLLRITTTYLNTVESEKKIDIRFVAGKQLRDKVFFAINSIIIKIISGPRNIIVI